MHRRRLDGALVGLAALVVASTIARFALSSDVHAPWIAPDEQLYGLLGRALVSGDGLTLLGEPAPYYSLLYPLFVGVPFLVWDLADAVRSIQLLQAFVMSLTAVPVYLWARPAAGRGWALVAAGLTVAIPGLTYSGLLMSEALYYPVAVVAVWALARCLHRPTVARQAVFLGALGLALATRLQAVGFVVVLVVAAAVLAVAERDWAPFRRLAPTFGFLAALGVVWTGTRVALGGIGELLGAYAPLAEATEYSLGDVAQSIAWETGAVTLITLGVPLVALGVLAWETLRGREDDAGVRALVAAAFAYTTVTVVEVGAFASRFVEHVTERQLLSVAPPLFVALAVWLGRGAPRPQPATSIVALGVAATALLLPLDRVTVPAVYADAPSLIPLERLQDLIGQSGFEATYALALAVLLLASVLLPRRLVVALPLALAATLCASALVASLEVRNGSQTERERTFDGVRTDWVDATGATGATLVVTGDRFWPSAWETVFWNPSITSVVRLAGALSPGALPQEVVRVRDDGRMIASGGREVSSSLVVAPSGLSVVGAPVAETPASFEQPGMVLWRVEEPLRVSRRIVGLRPNGDLYTGESARIRIFGCGPGRLELTLLGKEGKPTRVYRGDEILVERAIRPGKVWRPTVPAPPAADGTGSCVYRLESDGLVGSTRIEYVRDPVG